MSENVGVLNIYTSNLLEWGISVYICGWQKNGL